MRILYADDDADLRQFFRRAAGVTGHECVIVDNAIHAWELLQSGERFDLIVSDYNMPSMNGLEFLKKVRGFGATKNTPFVLYTGNDSSELKSEVIQLEAVFEFKGAMKSLRDTISENLPQT